MSNLKILHQYKYILKNTLLAQNKIMHDELDRLKYAALLLRLLSDLNLVDDMFHLSYVVLIFALAAKSKYCILIWCSTPEKMYYG